MILWKKTNNSDYESSDGRFRILKDHDRKYGNNWYLLDYNERDYHKGIYPEMTLRECKLRAETLT